MRILLIFFVFFLPFLVFSYPNYSNTKTYQIGEIVTYNSKDYEAQNVTKGNPPDVSTWFWSLYQSVDNNLEVQKLLRDINEWQKIQFGAYLFIAGLICSLIFAMKFTL